MVDARSEIIRVLDEAANRLHRELAQVEAARRCFADQPKHTLPAVKTPAPQPAKPQAAVRRRLTMDDPKSLPGRLLRFIRSSGSRGRTRNHCHSAFGAESPQKVSSALGYLASKKLVKRTEDGRWRQP